MTAPEPPTQYPTPPRPAPALVGRAVAAALVTEGSTADLRHLVCDYVRALKEAGVPPEQALARLKDVVGLSSTTLRARSSGSLAFDELGRSVIEWFIGEYYRAD